MTLTARDRKLLLAIVPIVLLVGFWMLVLGPKREEAQSLGSELADAQAQRDEAVGRVQLAEQARTTYAADYETVVRLGKAVPARVDMPSLLVQLDSAARGTQIDFTRVVAGERTPAGQPAPVAATPPAGGAAPGGAPAPAGGAQPPEPAASAPGQAAQTAEGAVADANAGAAQAGATTEQGQPTTPTGTPPAPSPAAPAAPGLESVPLDFSFSGRFFDLADFLHELKRFVYVREGGEIVVRGRLITIDQISFRASANGRRLDATIKASAFLAPRAEGVTAGATPAAPAPAPATPPATTAGGSAPAPPTAARIP